MFRINTYGTGSSWEVWQLEDVQQNMRIDIVPSAGGILNAWWVGDVNIIDGYSGHGDFLARVHAGFRSAKLLPFAGRLHEASYAWQGRSYRLDKFLLNGSALHGLVYDQPFVVDETWQDQDGCGIKLIYQYPGDHPGYPFRFSCEVVYRLGAGGLLEISTKLGNPSDGVEELPLVDGWHPYFVLGDVVDQWRLKVQSDQMLEYSDALIPTGRYLHDESFLYGATIGNRELDNGFLLREDVSPFCELTNPANGITVAFIQQQHYPFLQLYIPDDRKSIAIENLSGAPDAFNNGMGVTVLKPGNFLLLSVQMRAWVEK